MQGSAYPTFDPLAGLRAAAAAREAAGLRRSLAPRAADDATLDLASNDHLGLSGDPRLAECGVRVGCFRPPSVPAGEACLQLTGRATLTDKEIAAASRALAVARDHCHHCRNTAQAGRNTP
jgi:8-amino-7-oxononanoate synthase